MRGVWWRVVGVALIPLFSCSGTREDIAVTVTVDAASLGKDGMGKLNGSITVTVALGAYAPDAHTVTPPGTVAVHAGTRTLFLDLGSAPYNPSFAAGDTRTTTFPLTCATADDCGASVVCAPGATATVDFAWSDRVAGGMPAPQTASSPATIACP
jgi:hypothetical protein